VADGRLARGAGRRRAAAGTEWQPDFPDPPEGHLRGRYPATTFAAEDIEEEYRRMTERGVVFTAPPARSGDVTGAVFDDTCGNLVGLFQA
jgi:predicted enzyme related to lactoylglutathione lyase